MLEAAEAGDVDALLNLLTFQTLPCAPRTEARPFEWCAGSGEQLEVYPWNGRLFPNPEYQERTAFAHLLGQILGGERHSLELIARRDDGTYTAIFAVDTRIAWRPGIDAQWAPAGLWFQIPPGRAPRPLAPDGRPLETVNELVLGALEKIQFEQAQNRSNPAYGHQYEIWWVSDEQLEIEAKRHRQLIEDNKGP